MLGRQREVLDKKIQGALDRRILGDLRREPPGSLNAHRVRLLEGSPWSAASFAYYRVSSDLSHAVSQDLFLRRSMQLLRLAAFRCLRRKLLRPALLSRSRL